MAVGCSLRLIGTMSTMESAAVFSTSPIRPDSACQSPSLSTDRGNIFVTGNSLGAYGAELAAREFGYGGVGFGGPGIPGYRAPAERAGNFVNYLLRGDPVAEHATDAAVGWAGWQGAAEAGDHYGRIEWLGRAATSGRSRRP